MFLPNQASGDFTDRDQFWRNYC